MKDIKKVIKFLKMVLNESTYDPIDYNKQYIVDKEEQRALKVVIDLLHDLT